jgi:hypothetical protein
VNCAVTEIFRSNWLGGIPLEVQLRGTDLDKPGKPDGFEVRARLLEPAFQAAFSTLLKNTYAQARVDDIDWHEVAANWDLPFRKRKGAKK